MAPPSSNSSSSAASARSRFRIYCFTYFGSRVPVFDPARMEYLTYGHEMCPRTGRTHLQGFLVFKKRQYLSGCRSWLPGAYFEPCRGTLQQNLTYCRKGDDYRDFGRLPTGAPAPQSRFSNVVRLAESGNFAELKEMYPAEYLRYRTSLLSCRKFPVAELEESCGVWLCGPPRSGKDFAVRQFAPEGESIYDKAPNKWWDSYDGERIVLVSDLDPSHSKVLGYYLKIWADRYPFPAEVKGSCITIRPRALFVTSNFPMEEVFSGNILKALQARFAVYTLGEDGRVAVRPRPTYPARTDFLDALRSRNDVPDFARASSSSSTTSSSPPSSARTHVSESLLSPLAALSDDSFTMSPSIYTIRQCNPRQSPSSSTVSFEDAQAGFGGPSPDVGLPTNYLDLLKGLRTDHYSDDDFV